MNDLISRQAAIDALDEIESEVADGYGYQYEKWRKYFCELPSAQPERASCKQVTGKLDLISRQDAIDAIVKLTNCNTPKDLREYVAEHSLWNLWSGGVLEALEAVEGLPSTQPERAIKDCRNCKHGNYNDHWDTYFCYHSGDCNDWDKWESSAQPEQINPCTICQEFDCYGCKFRRTT